MVIRSASKIGAVLAAKAVKPLATAAKPQLAKGARDVGTRVAREAVTSWRALAGLVHIVAALLVGASPLCHRARRAVCALLALVAFGPITAGIAIRPSGAGNGGRRAFAACVAAGTAVARPLARFILEGAGSASVTEVRAGGGCHEAGRASSTVVRVGAPRNRVSLPWRARLACRAGTLASVRIVRTGRARLKRQS